MGHLCSDLMKSAGHQLDVHQGRFFREFPKHFIPQFSPLCILLSRLRFGYDLSLFPCTFIQIIHKGPFLCGKFSTDDGLILFIQPFRFLLKLRSKCRCCVFILCEYQKSFHRLIQTMNDPQIGLSLGAAFFCQIIFQFADRIRLSDLGGLSGQPCRLVYHQHILILIQNLCPHRLLPSSDFL